MEFHVVSDIFSINNQPPCVKVLFSQKNIHKIFSFIFSNNMSELRDREVNINFVWLFYELIDSDKFILSMKFNTAIG